MSEVPDQQPVVPLAPPQTLYTVNLTDDNNQKGDQVGGTYDNQSAVMVMCAVYNAMQRTAPVGGRVIGVWDNTDTVIAYIGKQGGGA